MEFSLLSDAEVLRELGGRIRETRLGRNIGQESLAREAGVSVPTVERMEGGNSTSMTSLVRVLRALGLIENLGVLIPPPLPSPIDLAKREGKRRKRASRKA